MQNIVLIISFMLASFIIVLIGTVAYAQDEGGFKLPPPEKITETIDKFQQIVFPGSAEVDYKQFSPQNLKQRADTGFESITGLKLSEILNAILAFLIWLYDTIAGLIRWVISFVAGLPNYPHNTS